MSLSKNIKEIYLSKALTCMIFFLSKQKKAFFIKETDTFGHIVVWTFYTPHIDHFTPLHTAFEQLAACLSVYLEYLPGLIPFTILWHHGWTLGKKTVASTWTLIIWLRYLEVFWPNKYVFLLLFTIFHFYIEKLISKRCKHIFFYQKFVHFGRKYF